MVATEVQQVIDKKVAFWAKIAFGTVTVSVISLMGVFFLALSEVRASAKAYANQIAQDEVKAAVKTANANADVPKQILATAVTVAQDAAKASASAAVASEEAGATVVELQADIDEAQGLLRDQKVKIRELDTLLDKVQGINTKEFADKVAALEGVLKEKMLSDTLTALLANVKKILEKGDLSSQDLHVKSLRVGGGTGVFITEDGIVVGNGGLVQNRYVVQTHRLPSQQ